MPEVRSLIEREMRRVEPPPFTLERFHVRRARRRRNQRLVAGVVGVAVALAGLFIAVRAIRSVPQPTHPSPVGSLPELRRGSEVIEFAPMGRGVGVDVAARDPGTGRVRELVETGGILGCRAGATPCAATLDSAAWSADGRWVAFEVVPDPGAGRCTPSDGLWVKSALAVARQVTRTCAGSTWSPASEPWTWSPARAELIVARPARSGSDVLLIDPATGRRTRVAAVDREVAALAASPDGTRIAYASGGTIGQVDLGTGEVRPLSSGFRNVGEIAWAPAGGRILVLDRVNIEWVYVMNDDGSGVRLLGRGARDVCCGAAWSPDGRRVAFSTATGHERYAVQFWVTAVDGSAPRLLTDSGCCVSAADGPVWSPDGRRVAYRYDGGRPYGSGAPGARIVWQASNGDGSGADRVIGDALARSWRGGWYAVDGSPPGSRR